MAEFLIHDAEAVETREKYLASVQKSLTGQSSGEAYETVSEMRQHLDAMALADMELGSTPGTAMKAAVERFGAPEAIILPNPRIFQLTLERRSLLKTILASLVLFGLTEMSVMSVLLVLFHSAQQYGVIVNEVLGVMPAATLVGFAAHLSLARPIKFAVVVSLTYAVWMTVSVCFNMFLYLHTWLIAGPLLSVLIQTVCYFAASLSIANYAARVRKIELRSA